MIQYINKKDIYGPFMKRQDVYLPHSAEVTSDKYTNMRYQVTVIMMMMIGARNKSSRRFYNHRRSRGGGRGGLGPPWKN